MPDNKIRFTKAALSALEPPESGRYYCYDERTGGLAICVTQAGTKTFYRYQKVNGRPVRLRLGRFPEMTIEQARKLALKAAADIADGKDPQVEKQSKRTEMTFGELHSHYMEHHAKPHKKSWKDDENLFNRYLTGWKNRQLSGLSKADIQQRHQTLGETAPVAANRMLALVSKMFSVAIGIGAWNGINPCPGIKRFRERSRERFLQPDELPRFFTALNGYSDETMRDYFLVSLLVGARRGNMLAMRWNELNLSRAEWRIPDSKNGDALTVHLAPKAVEVLQARHENANGSPFVFPGRGKTGHIVEPKKAWATICETAGIDDLRIHDLRRTLGSWQAAHGASLPIIGKALGHKNQATTAIYARLNIDPVRESVDRATAAMLEHDERGVDEAKSGNPH